MGARWPVSYGSAGLTPIIRHAELILVRKVPDDLPTAVGLFAENSDAGLCRNHPGRRTGRTYPKRPDQSHHGEIARNKDFFDLERIDIFLGPVAQRTLQEPTDIVKAALQMPSIIVAQVGSKEPTNLTRITAIEIPRPSDQRFANRRFVRPAGLS